MVEGNDPNLSVVSSDESADHGSDGARSRAKIGGSNVTVIEQALWKQIVDAETPRDIASAWLSLQCKMIPNTLQGVVVLGDPDGESFSAVAYWPIGIEKQGGAPDLIATAEKALAKRSGIVQGKSLGENKKHCDLAYPFIIDDQIHGVVAIEIESLPKSGLREVMRQLQWGASWMENVIRRRESTFERDTRDQVALALELVAAILDKGSFDSACTLVAGELAVRLGCSRVGIGFRDGGHAVVKTLSHTAQFATRMNLINLIGAAMDEALDQHAVVVYPYENNKRTIVTYAHAELAKEHGAGSVLSVPFVTDDGNGGVLTFERPQGEFFDQTEVDLCDCVVTAVGPMLVELRRREQPLIKTIAAATGSELKRYIGAGYYGRKLAVAIALILVVFFSFAKGDYRVTAEARLEGLVQRAIVGSFNGYVLNQHVRAGDLVKTGQLLAALDDKDLKLERLGWEATRQQHLAEYARALAEHNRAEANIVKAQIEQAVAQKELLDEQIKRAELRAPFDGLVVSGDLSQSIGTSVQRGEVLFEIAPLDAYRVILDVDESDISEITEGQMGSLVISSIPDEAQALVVEKITPISNAREGRNVFQVEARLQETSARLRPGMEGIGKISIEKRHLIWIVTHKITDWLRLWFWEWLP